MAPAIAVLLWLDHRAIVQGLVDGLAEKKQGPKTPLVQRAVQIFHELDTFGLILLGFGWSLVSLPESSPSDA